jgi:alpha-aminoadipate carrier protein LysW
MVNCPVCDAGLDIDEDELDEGDEFTCDECGAELAVVGTDPLEIETAADGDEDDEDEDDLDEDEDEDEDEELEDEEENEDEDWK